MLGHQDLPWLRHDRLEAWLVDHVPGRCRPPLVFKRLRGGNSNISVHIEDAGGANYVLRRPPEGEIQQTAHDVLREHRIVDALQDTAVPVPRTIVACDDVDVTGAPFSVVEYVDGPVFRSAREMEAGLAAPARRRLAHSLVDTLRTLHSVRPADVSLDGLGRGHGYVTRQISRWTRQVEASDSDRRPRLQAVGAALGERVPSNGPVAIVHGDYRLGNCVVRSSGDVRAVLDWELCTLGDPLADLGYLLLDWAGPDRIIPAPTRHDEFPTRDEIVRRYLQSSQLEPRDVNPYIAFAAWRRACILEGVEKRRRQNPGEAATYRPETIVERLLGYLRIAEEFAA